MGWMKKRQFWSTLSEGVELMTDFDWYDVAKKNCEKKKVTNFSDIFSENSEICQNYRHSRWLNFQKRIRFHKIFTKIGDKKKHKLEGIVVTRIGDIFVT